MNRPAGIMHGNFLCICRGIPRLFLLLVLGLVNGAWAAADRPPLPPGYAYPQAPTVRIPDPFFDRPTRCPSCAGEDGELRFYYRDYVGFRRNLDTYAPRTVTWELLTFEHGFKQPWLGPQFAIRLYQHTPDQVRVVTRERLVVFNKVTDADGKVSLTCISDDDWSIRRDGERVVVQNAKRWFAFETPDFGQSWRLVEACPIGIPVPVKLHYGGPIESLPSALEYPDGKTAIIEPAQGLEAVGKIKLPNGMEYRIEYDPAGFPRVLEEYVLTKKPPKQVMSGFLIESRGGKVTQTVNYKEVKQERLELTRRWFWENDDQGRIRHMVPPCGQELSVDFAKATTDAGDETLAIVTDASTGDYRYLRHIEQGATWTIDRGHGKKGQPIEQAAREIRTIQKKLGHEMRVVSVEKGTPLTVTTAEYSRQGVLQKRVVRNKDGDLLCEHRPLPPTEPVILHGPGGRATAWTNGTQLVHYGYDARGFLAWAETGSRKNLFVCDTLGRLLHHESPGGVATTWTYDGNGRLEAMLHDWGNQQRFGFRYEYDLAGHLASITPTGLEPVVYRYACERLGSVVDRDGLTQLRYDDSGRLTTRQTALQRESFHYAAGGQLDRFTCAKRDGSGFRVWFRYSPDGVRLVDRTEGTLPAELLVGSRDVQVHRPGMPEEPCHRWFNALGALAQPPGSTLKEQDMRKQMKGSGR